MTTAGEIIRVSSNACFIWDSIFAIVPSEPKYEGIVPSKYGKTKRAPIAMGTNHDATWLQDNSNLLGKTAIINNTTAPIAMNTNALKR